MTRWPERVWYGDSAWAHAARNALAPASWLYAGAAALRNAAYDAGVLPSFEPKVPALVIGNLSVGGTGKTPVAAWAASALLAAGARPAIVLRGYGADEPLVHARLNPGAVVIADSDRVRGVERAAAAGADCAILDDAFQHRRIQRGENWLLVAAEQWRGVQRCLPAGPLRESPSAVRRASLVVVTRKSATLAYSDDVARHVMKRAPDTPVALLHLAPDGLRAAIGDQYASLQTLEGARVLVVAAIGAPEAFFAQLRGLGAEIEALVFADHHAFGVRDVQAILHRAARTDFVVCTLKDAVKLAPLWPHKGPALWYVSQTAVIERGRTALDASLTTLLAARASASPNAGSSGPDFPAHGHRSSTADQ